MRVNIKSQKNVNVTIEMSDAITLGDSKLVKTWMADTKSILPDYIASMVEKAERDLKIGFTDIYHLEVTYYSSFEMPVVMIVGRGYDRRPGSDLSTLFVEAFTDENEGTTENRYTKTA